MTIALLFIILALICFIAAAAGISSPVNLTALGLVFLTVFLALGTLR
jgi:hypothetical protein